MTVLEQLTNLISQLFLYHTIILPYLHHEYWHYLITRTLTIPAILRISLTIASDAGLAKSSIV